MNIVEEFFKHFDIKPNAYCSKVILNCGKYIHNKCDKDCPYFGGVYYPKITDSIIINLISLMTTCSLDKFKEAVIRESILADHIDKIEVRKLFGYMEESNE